MKSASRAIVLGVIISAMSLPVRADFIADQSRIRLAAVEMPILDLVDCRIDNGANPTIRPAVQ
jgi:hypothetical protein